MRVGIGYDIHKLGEGRCIVLGGITIPFDKGLIGHSDADVLLHSICDAMLGAAGAGDIGIHFPDTDPTFKDISSVELLRRTNGIVENSGYSVSNIDSVVIAEAPRISPYRDAMIKNIASVLKIESHKMHVKATTNEAIGPIGRGEGIAVYSVCLLV